MEVFDEEFFSDRSRCIVVGDRSIKTISENEKEREDVDIWIVRPNEYKIEIASEGLEPKDTIDFTGSGINLTKWIKKEVDKHLLDPSLHIIAAYIANQQYEYIKIYGDGFKMVNMIEILKD